jgi:hypothetical protein
VARKRKTKKEEREALPTEEGGVVSSNDEREKAACNPMPV